MPSLSEILQDPNYVNANEATKQAIFEKYSALDENFTTANPATQDAIRQKFGVPVTKAQPTIDVLGQQFTPEEYQKAAKETGSSLQLPTELLKEGEKAKGAFSGMFGRSLYDYAADMALAWGKASGNTEQAEQEAKRLREYGEKTYTPSTKSFKEDPLEKIQELAGGSAPYMLGPIAAAMLAPEGSIGIAAATFPRLAGIAASTPAFTGSNLQRQMEADNIKLADTNLLKAGSTAVFQSVLDQVGFSFIPGIKNIFTKAGMEIADEAAEALVKKSILARAGELALKTGEGMGIEGGTEAAQQLLERLQAGLSITDADARKEYFESFVGGAVLGGALGVPGHLVETLFPEEPQKPKDLTEQEQPPGPPAPPGAPPAPPAAPPAAPTAGAISDTEFDDTDITGVPPPEAAPAEPVIKTKKQADAEEAAAKALAEEERNKALLDMVKKGQEAKPIEDKEVEAEAKSIQSEIEKYNPAFASGMKNAVDKGRIQTSEDLEFYRGRLAEYKAQAGAGKSPIKETYNSMTFFQDDPAVLKLREKALESAPQDIKDKIAKADELLQKIADRINSEGYSINEPNAPQNIKNLQARASNIGADVSQVLKKSEQIQKGRKIASPEKLAQKEAMLDESIADATKDVVEYPEAQKFELKRIPIDLKDEKGYTAYSLDTDGNFTREDVINGEKEKRTFMELGPNDYEWMTEEDAKKANVKPATINKNSANQFIAKEEKFLTSEVEKARQAQKEAEPEVALPPKGLPKDIQDRLERLHRLATLAERKVMDKPITMDDVVNAYNRAEDSKKAEILKTTEENITKEAQGKVLQKADELYKKQTGKSPAKNVSVKAVKNGSLDISSEPWAKDFYDLFNIKEVKPAPKTEGLSKEVADQLQKFNAGVYTRPEKIRGTDNPDLQESGTPTVKEAETQNSHNLKVYEDAAKAFLEGPLDATPGKTPRDRIDTEKFEPNNIQPQSIEKKSADKVVTNYEEQNKVLGEILNPKEVRAFAHGILIDRENDRMVACDGSRATILKKPNFSGVPEFVSDSPEVKLGDPILKPDNTWEDGKYPDINRIIPESHSDLKLTVSTKDLSDYARGVEKANKFLQLHGTFNVLGTFDAKYIRQMGDLFRKFGYKNITISLHEGNKLLATSNDGKLMHIVMGMRDDNPIFKRFSAIFKVEKAKGARPDGQTIESIKDRIVREFGKSVQSLIRDGLIVVVNSVNELEPKYQNELDDKDKAFFDKETGVAYIIVDRVSAGDVRKVVLHEVGEHYGLRGMLGEKVYNEQLENLKKQKNRDITVAKAWDYVLKNYTNLLETDEKQFLREVMAKIGEDAPNHRLWKRFVTAIKSFLVKKGIIKNLTGQELQDLVMRSLHTTIQGRRVLSSGTGLESPRGPSDPDA